MRKKLILPEVAEVVTFLFSEKADAINGQVIQKCNHYLGRIRFRSGSRIGSSLRLMTDNHYDTN
ncbi:hypothetical protein IOC57_12905 [Bacillus sp. SD075]|uniref:hypothetical protein n=1 Tax=Bacillus sp. SD075 TaxID=2781732 RepID=UPI001A96B4D7|nr:hypothetical protein [Bacillus sp. SD075]MBO0998639.1 hypothetical protein [Bacillus sp. SD075]